MRKAEINNDIVLLRAPVRQARISIINKLVREAQKLRSNRGNEKQLEKNKRKADRILKQIYALKPIKDDEITKFGIVKWDDLEDMSKNQTTDDVTRIMAKIVCFKPLKEQIKIFREKFPDYKEHVSFRKKPVRKKKGINPEKSVTANVQKSLTQIDVKEKAIDTVEEKTDSPCERLQSTECHKKKKSDRSNKKSTKGESVSTEKDAEDSVQLKEDHNTENSLDRNESKPIVKVISEEATVKRFTEILQETGPNFNVSLESDSNPPLSKQVEMETEVDDFFMNTDNTNVYTVASCSKESTNNSDDDRPSRVRSARDKFQSNFNQNRDLKLRDGRKRKWETDNAPRDRNRPARAGVSYRNRGQEYIKPETKFARNTEESATNVEPENLHPSWAARKKQQDILKQGFQGKKIVFGDD